MEKSKTIQTRGKYTLEFKLEAVRLVKGGQAVPVTAKILGMSAQTLGTAMKKAPEVGAFLFDGLIQRAAR